MPAPPSAPSPLRPRCHIGTSGWQYAHWAKGRFYPRGLRQSDWLVYYAQHFPCVEINYSFYRIPNEAAVARWLELTEPPFQFAVKLWRGITHLKRLLDAERELASFLAILSGLGDRRGPLLIQLPPSMRKNASRLDEFLTRVEGLGEGQWRLAVEFRNGEWLCPEIYEILDRHNTALCLADMPYLSITQPNRANFLYIRRHGGSSHPYAGRYTPGQIADDARRIRSWIEEERRDVYVFYNNDVGGHALDNARQLTDALRDIAQRPAEIVIFRG